MFPQCLEVRLICERRRLRSLAGVDMLDLEPGVFREELLTWILVCLPYEHRLGDGSTVRENIGLKAGGDVVLVKKMVGKGDLSPLYDIDHLRVNGRAWALAPRRSMV